MELMNVPELARFLKVKPHSVRNWIIRETIPKELVKRKLGKIYFIKSEIEEFMVS